MLLRKGSMFKNTPQPKVPVIQERVLSLQPNTAMKFCSSITDPPAILGPYFPTTNSQSGIPVFLVFKGSPRECCPWKACAQELVFTAIYASLSHGTHKNMAKTKCKGAVLGATDETQEID